MQTYVPFRTLIPDQTMLLADWADSVCLCEYIVPRGIDAVVPNVVAPVTDRLIELVFVSVD